MPWKLRSFRQAHSPVESDELTGLPVAMRDEAKSAERPAKQPRQHVHVVEVLRTVLVGSPVAVDLDLPLEHKVRAVGDVPLELSPGRHRGTGWDVREGTADGEGERGEGRTGRCT